MRDRSGQIAAVAFTFAILTWITVGLRCYVRMFMVKSFGLDDQLMVGTALLYSAYLVCQLGGAFHGSGVKRENLTDWQAQTALNYWYLCEVFYTLSTSLLKFAVGFFLLRITINPIHIWIIRAIMIITAFVGTTYTVLVLCQCRPMSYWWDLSPDAKGECLSASLVVIFTYAVSALNSVADWTFGLLPIFIVKDLQMKKRAKVIVSSVIGLAAIGSTATIIRLPYTGTMKPYKGDFLYRTTDFAMWTTVEVGVGIVAGSMATLRPLVSSTMGSSGQGSGKWWSRKKSSMFSGSLPMDRLRPTQEKAVTKTTITGGRMSEDSDKKVFLDTGSRPEQWKNGINKSISTTVVEERAEGSQPTRTPNLHQHHSNMDSRRAGSPGAESTSTVGDHGSGNATKVHDRF